MPEPTYCERLNSGIFGEPLNLITSLFFIGSALLARRKLHNANVAHRSFLQFLTVLIAIIGAGSAVFHAIPNHFTLLLDGVPIYIFVLSALIFLLKKLSGKWYYAIALTTAFASLLILASIYVPTSFLNGSTRHMIILLSLVGLFYWCYKKYGRMGLHLLPVLILYGTAITARSIDQVVCSIIPFGTHFIWHILNAAICYFIIAFLIRVDTPSQAKA